MKRSSRERADGESVSELTTARLSVYLRSLEALEAAGVNTVSSRGRAEQFRQALNPYLTRPAGAAPESVCSTPVPVTSGCP